MSDDLLVGDESTEETATVESTDAVESEVSDGVATDAVSDVSTSAEVADETAEEEATEEAEEADESAAMFTPAERKVAYLVSGILGIIAGVCVIVGAVSGASEWVAVVGACVNMAASSVAALFGVRYVQV